MNWLEAFILGLLQGLTEFLPVSSSGHLELGKALLGVEIKENLLFTLVVHAATVCSTIVVYRKDLGNIISKSFEFKWNTETQYLFKILLSSVPVVIVGVLFEDYVEELFSGKLLLVGFMLLVTAGLLSFTFYTKSKDKDLSFKDAFIVGIAQAFAVLPGISRSGATIATALILKNGKTQAARFSFLMVLLPVLGKLFLDIVGGEITTHDTSFTVLLAGFISAFIFGLLACKLMIQLVKRSKLIYFAAYCLIVGLLTIVITVL